MVISAISYAALRYRVERHLENSVVAERVLVALIQDIPVLPFEVGAAGSYGILRGAVRSGQRDALNRLIAAHAVSLSLTLVPNNEADFLDYPGLVVENWIRSSH